MSTCEVGVLTFIGIVLSAILWRKFNYTPPGSIEKDYFNYAYPPILFKYVMIGVFLWLVAIPTAIGILYLLAKYIGHVLG